ncbi:MAG: hypothetical protein ABII25_01475 [bacterium]
MQTRNYDDIEELILELYLLLRLEIDALYKIEKMRQIEKRFL